METMKIIKKNLNFKLKKFNVEFRGKENSLIIFYHCLYEGKFFKRKKNYGF